MTRRAAGRDRCRGRLARAIACCTAAAAAAALAGCRAGPDYETPRPELPVSFAEAAGLSAAVPVALERWWRAFEDPALDSLIERGLSGNLDLRAAAARVREARALRGAVEPSAWPELDATGSYARSRRSENARFGSSAAGAGASSGSGIGGDLDQDLFEAGFDATWELDLFGATRRAIEAAAAEIDAAEEDAHAVRVTLVAEVARNYVEMRSFARRRAISEESERTQATTLALTRARFDAGIATSLDVARAEAQVESTRAAAPAFDAAARQAMHRLAVLLGLHAGALIEELSPLPALASVSPRVPAAVPADLLSRRPDLRLAERRLAAAVARIGVASAELYPRFSLTGTLGLRSEEIGDFLRGDSHFLSVGPAVRWRLFDRRRIGAEIGVAEERAEIARVGFEQALLEAVREVEDALVALEREGTRRESLARAVEAERRAHDLALDLHSKGITPFLDVLEVERSLLAAEDALALSDLAIAVELVALMKALGGGWELPGPIAGVD
ncbi:MAG: efflux transporter outer membrane subunit [Planctomycetes bacterium]|nr:efflux transporter outer membrane subunit [Planctomycetota bacterium]